MKLLQRKNEQQEYLKNLKEQMVVKKLTQEVEVTKKKTEEKTISGLKLAGHKPKESIHQITDIVRKQMAEKEAVRNAQLKV